MSGTRLGGVKAAENIKKKYGDDFFKKIGQIGGKAPVGGFSKNPQLAKKAGAMGGKKSRRSAPITYCVYDLDGRLLMAGPPKKIAELTEYSLNTLHNYADTGKLLGGVYLIKKVKDETQNRNA